MSLYISIVALLAAAFPAGLFLANLRLFRCLVPTICLTEVSKAVSPPTVSILIPARDEQSAIAECIEAALASIDVILEVIVLDDDSQDATASIVNKYAESDSRIRLIRSRPLPSGWNGKQHACKQLAEAAIYSRMLFSDADVRLKPGAIASLARYQDQTGVGLLSAFPHQITGTWLERWLIPMMHTILLCFLPMSRMRSHSDPSLGAGCGQLFLTTRDAYQQAGTHEAIKDSRHDGLKLPRAYRSAGIMTDVVDGTAIAQCRMYCNAHEVVRGILKNATEGIANPRLIVIFSTLLLGISLLPVVALAFSIANSDWVSATVSMTALFMAHLPRLIGAHVFRQSWFGALCHVPATILFVLLQWIALAGHISGHRIAWRGRT